jgi:hypothetical protein
MICQWCAVGHRMEKRYQPAMHRALQPLAPPLGAPDEVVHHQVDTVLLMWRVQGESREIVYDLATLNARREGPFSPRVQDGG